MGEATRDFGVSKPTVSGHLKVLEEAGVVVREVHGRRHDLRLAVDPLDEASTWLDTQRARWTRLFDTVEAYLGERKDHDDRPPNRPPACGSSGPSMRHPTLSSMLGRAPR